MQQWIQDRKLTRELALVLGAIFIFGTTDYLLQGQDSLFISTILALSLFFSRRLVLLSIPISLLGFYGAYYYSLGPLFGEMAPVFAIVLGSGLTHKAWVRRTQAVAIGLGLLFHGLSLVQSGYLNLRLPNESQIAETTVTYFAVFDFVLVLVASGYLVGRYAIFRQGHLGSSRDVAFLQDASDENQLRVAELNSRLAIAQDVSELLVQHVSAVISRAEGGIYAAKTSADSAARSLERVLENAQLANQEVRRLIDLLAAERDVSTAPPSLADLNALAVRYRELGFSVRQSNEGKAIDLTVGAQLAIYRIIFDTLRWFSETAPKGTEFSVDLIWSENGLQVLLKDNSIATSNRATIKSSEADVGYEVSDDVDALVEKLDNPTLSSVRSRASIYGGSAELIRVPGVGLTLSAYFPELRLISAETAQ